MAKLFHPSAYYRPSTPDEALRLLTAHGQSTKIVAGCTDFLVQKPVDANIIVDITGAGLDYIRSDIQWIHIGASTPFKEIAESTALQNEPYRLISEAARSVGHANLRYLATVGGNICNGVPSADAPPALIALSSEAIVQGPGGERSMPLEKLFIHVRKLDLALDEILKEIRVPLNKGGSTGFQKLRRTSVDIALVNVAAWVKTEENIITDSRVVLGAVAPVPLRAREAEAALIGSKVGEASIRKAAEAAATEAKPITDQRASAAYRRDMVRVLTRRALSEACGLGVEA